MKYETKYFGNIYYDPKHGTYTDPICIVSNGRTSLCNLHIFEDEYFSQEKLKSGLDVINELEVLDQLARKEFLLDYHDEGEVEEFIQIHFEDYGDEVTQKIAKKLETPERNDALFLEKLELGNVSLANSDSLKDEGEGQFIITLDYSLIWLDGSSFTDQILVARFDQNSQFLYVTHES